MVLLWKGSFSPALQQVLAFSMASVTLGTHSHLVPCWSSSGRSILITQELFLVICFPRALHVFWMKVFHPGSASVVIKVFLRILLLFWRCLPALHHPKFHSCLQDVCANTVRSCIRSDTLPDMICLRPLTRKSDILTSHTLSSMINPCGLLPLLFSHPLIACLHYRNSPPILPTESTMPVLIGSLNSPEFNFTWWTSLPPLGA